MDPQEADRSDPPSVDRSGPHSSGSDENSPTGPPEPIVTENTFIFARDIWFMNVYNRLRFIMFKMEFLLFIVLSLDHNDAENYKLRIKLNRLYRIVGS